MSGATAATERNADRGAVRSARPSSANWFVTSRLSQADIAAILRCRGDHNRLGYALMLCYLRYPGRALRAGERPPAALLAFVAEQIGVLPDVDRRVSRRERNRQRHAIECQRQLGLRPFGKQAAAELTGCCCRRPSKTIGSPIWRRWRWRRAGNAKSLSRRLPRSSGSAPNCAAQLAGKCIAD